MCAALIAFGFAAVHRTRSTQSLPNQGGLHVSGRDIVEGGGEAFVMRGVSHPYAWYKDQNQSFADIKRLGANTVRVVLTDGVGADEVAGVISTCRQHRLICVLEYHGTTGYGEDAASVTLDAAADYWLGLRQVLAGQEAYVVINVGNEPYGNHDTAGWTGATKGAVAKLRGAGLKHLVMVDAPNWGQDWSGVMRGNASAVFDADPLRNTVFSVHMYGVYGTAAKVTGYFDAFRDAGLPLVVGEFGWKHSDGGVDADTIMREAQARGIGYLGWSWSGNGGGVEYLDMADGFDAGRPTAWGRRIFDGADGIRATAREARVYGGAEAAAGKVRGPVHG
ncbi:glycoside hydrolase family 5 protein [Dactylosporangium sp. NBC_01737]|uniref:cellulase family glycosylhydrolase n=1 Tax=Dactylosporangium sp. NBC_01737 TaxID=2975959 RepID=UPI002E137547|nr:glycoside hydrolase family 5 protein [Dactylosporangium sp. NBC_01737]